MKNNDQAWQEQLVLHLRLAGIPGARIGDIVAEVQAHCADSGQLPEEAFGKSADYAAKYVDVVAPLRLVGAFAGTWFVSSLGIATTAAVISAASAWLKSEPTAISQGLLLTAVTGGWIIAWLFSGGHPARWVAWSSRRTFAVLWVAFMVSLAPIVWLRDLIFTAPPAILLGGGLPIIGGLLAWVVVRSRGDRIVSPGRYSAWAALPRPRRK
jgi:hypothetical protein